MSRGVFNGVLIASVLLCVFVIQPASGVETNTHSPSQFQLFGLWEGTIHMDRVELNGKQTKVMFELTREGLFTCFTHDLFRGNPDALSTGKWVQEDTEVTLVDGLVSGGAKTVYKYRFVLREERNSAVSPQLFLHDYERGIHVHLKWQGPLSAR